MGLFSPYFQFVPNSTLLKSCHSVNQATSERYRAGQTKPDYSPWCACSLRRPPRAFPTNKQSSHLSQTRTSRLKYNVEGTMIYCRVNQPKDDGVAGIATWLSAVEIFVRSEGHFFWCGGCDLGLCDTFASSSCHRFSQSAQFGAHSSPVNFSRALGNSAKIFSASVWAAA